MKLKNMIKNLIFIYLFLYKHTPGFLFVTVVFNLISGILRTYVNISYLLKIFLILESGTDYHILAHNVVMLFLLSLILHIIQSVFWQRYIPIQKLNLKKIVQSLIVNKSSNNDLECYDNPEYYNDFIITLEKSDESLYNAVDIMGLYCNKIASIVTLIPLFYQVSLLLLIITLISVIISTIIQTKLNSILFGRYTSMSSLIRQNSYIMTRFAFWEYSQELRLNNFPKILLKQFEDTYNNMNMNIKAYSGKLIYLSLIKSITSGIVPDFFISFILAYNLLVNKSISVALFASMLSAITTIRQHLNDITNNYTRLNETSYFIEKLKSFLYYENKIVNGSQKPMNNAALIQFKNVSFKYPFSNHYIIKNLSIEIKSGEKIALVGLNGAGKSTILKLLLRFYDPDEGVIEYNKINIKNYDIEIYRKIIGVVFQDFNLYSVTLGENMFMDEIPYGGKLQVNNVLGKLYLTNKQLNIDTKISSEFDDYGITLSGGESQKIAISRILLKDYNTLILDEPSSALDPFMESELNEIISNDMHSSTLIFISHRLTTTTIVDKIFYLEDGTVTEKGTHTELMRLNGKYATLFNLQANKYRKKKI